MHTYREGGGDREDHFKKDRRANRKKEGHIKKNGKEKENKYVKGEKNNIRMPFNVCVCF